jgi:hypothetical protein
MSNVDVFNKASDALQQTFMKWIDAHAAATGADKTALCIEVGKAMVVMGGTFVSNALGIEDPHAGLAPTIECLRAYERLSGKEIDAGLTGGSGGRL